MDEIKKHKFFKNIDFTKDLRSQQAPFEPKIAYATDTSNFDPIDPDKLHDSTDQNFEDGFDSSKPFHHGFFEFTFRRFFDDESQSKINPESSGNKSNKVTNSTPSTDAKTEAIYV